MKPLERLLFPLSLLLLLSCSEEIIRETVSVKRIDLDSNKNRSVIRTLSFDCAVFIYTGKEISDIPSSIKKYYTTQNSSPVFFAVIISNESDQPIPDPEFSLASKQNPLSPDKTAYVQKYKSVPQKSRITAMEEFAESAFDYQSPYNFNFILPEDKIAYFIEFQEPPGAERYSLSVSVKTYSGQKIIDFEYMRREYRQKDEVKQDAGN